MTPEQKIKREILIRSIKGSESKVVTTPEEINEDNIDDLYEELYDKDDDFRCDCEGELRRGQVETGLPCDGSRHYESKSVAMKMSDGSWVGWTYWYGGGKHGESSSVEWMEDAYDLVVTEEYRKVLVREYKRGDVKSEICMLEQSK